MFQKHKQSGFHQFQMVLAYTVFKLVFLINLLGLGVAIDLDTQVVAILLPVHLAVSHVEEVFDAEFLTTWHLNEGHSSGDILLFRHPVSNDVIRGRPREIPVIRINTSNVTEKLLCIPIYLILLWNTTLPKSSDFQTLLFKQSHWLKKIKL